MWLLGFDDMMVFELLNKSKKWLIAIQYLLLSCYLEL